MSTLSAPSAPRSTLVETDLHIGDPKQRPSVWPDAPFDVKGRIVLLATDNSGPSQAATRIAAKLAERYGSRIHVVSVVDTSTAPIPPALDLALALADAATRPAIHEQQVGAVRDAIAEVLGTRVDWKVRMMLGTPASSIAREARHLRSALVVVGLKHHGRIDRILRDETVMGLIQDCGCPVLGVTEDCTDLPTRVLAAIDFAQPSITAARAARAVMGANGTMILTYVPPMLGYLPGDGEAVVHEIGVQAALDECRAKLVESGLKVELVVIHREHPRDVAELLLEQADASKCELISVGSSRRQGLDRWILGSVSAELVRTGSKSILVYPGTEGRHR